LWLPGAPDLGLRFAEKADLLKNAASVDPAKISHLDSHQTRQRPQPGLNAGYGRGGNALDQNDDYQAQQGSDAEDGPRQKPGQKMYGDKKWQSAQPKMELRQAQLRWPKVNGNLIQRHTSKSLNIILLLN
jgi:hypothetical protein